MGSWVLLIEHSPPCSFPRNCLKSQIIPLLASWWMKVLPQICSWMWMNPWGTLFLNEKFLELLCVGRQSQEMRSWWGWQRQQELADSTGLSCYPEWDQSILGLLFTKKLGFFFINIKIFKIPKCTSVWLEIFHMQVFVCYKKTTISYEKREKSEREITELFPV